MECSNEVDDLNRDWCDIGTKKGIRLGIWGN